MELNGLFACSRVTVENHVSNINSTLRLLRQDICLMLGVFQEYRIDVKVSLVLLF